MDDLNQNVNLVVTYNGNISSNFPVVVAASHPAVFTLDASGIGQGAVLNYNATTKDYTVNGTASTAAKGSLVSIFLTGFGLTTQSNPGDEATLITGAVAPRGLITVTIDGQTAAVQGSAAPLGSVPGVLQVNATVPSTGITSGNAVKLYVLVDGIPSQDGVTMAVK